MPEFPKERAQDKTVEQLLGITANLGTNEKIQFLKAEVVKLRKELEKADRDDDGTISSPDMYVDDAVEEIEQMDDVDQITSFVQDETRTTILDKSEERIAELLDDKDE